MSHIQIDKKSSVTRDTTVSRSKSLFTPPDSFGEKADNNLISDITPVSAQFKPVIQRTTVAYPVAGMDDFDTEIMPSATLFHGNNGSGALINGSNYAIISGGNNNPNDTHIDVFAHGNESQVGNFTESDKLKTDLRQIKAKAGMGNLLSVTLHSCLSAAKDEDTQKTVAGSLNESFMDDLELVSVKGHKNNTITDQNGNTRVLKEDKEWKDYIIAKRTAEDINTLYDEFFLPVGDEEGEENFYSKEFIDSNVGEPSDTEYQADGSLYNPANLKSWQIDKARKRLVWMQEEMEVPEEAEKNKGQYYTG